MKRIGREPNPAESSYRHAMENPEAADYHGRNLYHSRSEDPRTPWLSLSEGERDHWIGEAVEMFRTHADKYGGPDDPPPDGGLPLPKEIAA